MAKMKKIWMCEDLDRKWESGFGTTKKESRGFRYR